ncbi:ATP phosphoribosyltransferase regulatory subunit [Limnochorda pilosa]|uniref:ATP phosphoribosyltransferase regulatory subunit n=1 Tax=Limnochorda pilosa TaxID=1555112 RepID=UPI0026EFBF24|nr:ATP phosphoribosyltransferase regulatory subunit [Limnochorda pilosa]
MSTEAPSFNRPRMPRGVRDLLPGELRELKALEERLLEVFSLWGYQPVRTPSYEFEEALLRAAPQDDLSGWHQRLFRFSDREGNGLALRPDMTTPIARLVAGRLRRAPLPLRLCYAENVFRYEEPQAGRSREFRQAGVELIGSPYPEADAEVVALASRLLEGLGLRNFRLEIGHVGFVQGVLEGLGLGPEMERLLRRTLQLRDYVAYQRLVTSAPLPDGLREGLLRLPSLRGGGEVLDRARELARTPQAQAGLANLEEIWQLSWAHGVGAHVKLDLALVRDVSYYTGMVLEGLVEDVGYLLVTGGRYDDLVARFGRPLPATGFAVGLERLLLALERQGVWGLPPASGPLFITFDPARREEALAAAARLREGGCPVEVEVSRRDEVAQRGYARQRRVRLWARFLEGERGMVRVEPLDDEAGSRVKPVAEWVAEVLRAREEGVTAGGRAR